MISCAVRRLSGYLKQPNKNCCGWVSPLFSGLARLPPPPGRKPPTPASPQSWSSRPALHSAAVRSPVSELTHTTRATTTDSIDPANPLNSMITDISLAPKDSNGNVGVYFNFQMVLPTNLANFNGKLVADWPNRSSSRIGNYLVGSFEHHRDGHQQLLGYRSYTRWVTALFRRRLGTGRRRRSDEWVVYDYVQLEIWGCRNKLVPWPPALCAEDAGRHEQRRDNYRPGLRIHRLERDQLHLGRRNSIPNYPAAPSTPWRSV